MADGRGDFKPGGRGIILLLILILLLRFSILILEIQRG
jgi:hypothetical protein